MAIVVPPLFWTLQILLLGSFANYACFPADTPLSLVPDNMRWVQALEIGFNLLAVLATLASGWISLHYYRQAQHKLERSRGPLSLWRLDRLCFMSLGGILSSGGFLIAVVFETIASLMVLPCHG